MSKSLLLRAVVEVASSDGGESGSLSLPISSKSGVNLVFELRANLRGFILVCLEAVEPILLTYGCYYMFTTLQGFSITSRPSMSMVYSSGEGSFAFFGETIIDAISKSYCETSIMSYGVNTITLPSS